MTWKFQTIRTAQAKAADAGNQELHDGTSVDRNCYKLLFRSRYCLRRETFKSWFCWLYSCDKDLQSADFQALASFPKFFNANPVSTVEPWIFVPEHQIHTTIHKRHTRRHTNPKHDPSDHGVHQHSIPCETLQKGGLRLQHYILSKPSDHSHSIV